MGIVPQSFLPMSWMMLKIAHCPREELAIVSGHLLPNCLIQLITFSAEFDVFLSDLNVESIDRAIACFKDGINSCKVLPSDFDPSRAQLACYRIYKLTEKGSTAANSMYDIPRFWINLEGLTHSSNLNIIESWITRVCCMKGALRFHHWLANVIPAAVGRISRNTWLDRLTSDVRCAIETKQAASFDSADYLPLLTFPKVYSLEPPIFRYDQTELIISVTSSIVRLWLRFPSDESSFVQLSLINIVTSKSLPSILFLDKIWDMYKTPFSTVFNKWNKRTGKTKLKNSLVNFENRFTHHPFAMVDSLEYRKLQFLSELTSQWLQMNNMNEASRFLHVFFLLLILSFFFSSSSKNPQVHQR